MKKVIIISISIVIFILAGFAVSQLEIVSNMEEMLPSDSESLKASKDFNQYFEGQDQAVVVVTKSSADMDEKSFHIQAEIFLQELAYEIEKETYIDSVFYQVDLNEMKAFYWAYIGMPTYRDLEDALDSQDFLSINQILNETRSQVITSEQSMYQFIVNDKGTHYLMYIRPIMDEKNYVTSRSNFYYGIQDYLEKILDKPDYSGLSAGLTGGAFIQDIEADTVAFDGLFATMGITFLLILAMVILFFGGLKLPLLSIYPLSLGAVVAAAFAYIIYRSLNMFAVSFALLLLGLGIDFAVHLITRYQEERVNGLKVEEAVKVSVRVTGGSIIIGALTTALAFASFAFAKFKAFEQMGVVSAIGIVSLCIGMLILVPVLILLFDKKQKGQPRKRVSLLWIQKIITFTMKKKWLIGGLMFVLLIFLFPFFAKTDLQTDITAIYPDNIPSLKWAQELEEAFDYDIDTLSFYADDEEQLKKVYSHLLNNKGVKGIDSVFEYMPDSIDKKLSIINRLDTALQEKGIKAFEDFDLRKPTIDDLSEGLKANFIGKDGKLRVEIIPAINIYDKKEYDELVSVIYGSTGRYPVGMSTIMNEITELVKNDILMISLFCFSIAFLISWIMFKKLRLAVLTMIPLALTLYTTIGLLSVLGVEINAFSIAAFPLIIGIGVDSSIHLIHRLKENSNQSIEEKTMHTGKAIILTSLTTIVGFGSLAMINHPGMANLGLTVAIGILISMLFTLLLIPLGFDLIKAKQS